MFRHYVKIAFRNILKYKTQTIISVCAMAVSVTLLSFVSSLMLTLTATPLFYRPYSDRVEQLTYANHNYVISGEDMALINGHQFKSAEEVHFCQMGVLGMMAGASADGKERRELLTTGMNMDPDFLRFYGAKSVISGDVVDRLSSGEVIITESLAKKLFDGRNPVGSAINIHTYDGNETERSYVVKDVMETLGRTSFFLSTNREIFLPTEEIPGNDRYRCMLLLRKGMDRETLKKEVSQLIPERGGDLVNVKKTYDETPAIIVRNCVIVFLFLFLCVSFTSYLRQQTQLFRIREREVAIRTCCGGKPGSLFLLFFGEIVIVLVLTLAAAIALDFLLTAYLVSNYGKLLEEFGWDLSGTVQAAVLAVSILAVVGMLAAAFTVRRIRRDQTGLAMRMRPRPSHRLRNVGITVQMVVSMLFTCLVFAFIWSVDVFEDWFGIPEDIDRYKGSMCVRLNGVPEDEKKDIYDRIEHLESIGGIYRFCDLMTYYVIDKETDKYSPYTEFHQNADDVERFYDIKVTEFPGNVDPDCNVVVSENFKRTMEKHGIWNGKTVRVNDREYEVRGTFGRIPFFNTISGSAVIITDASQPHESIYDCVILAKPGMEKETKVALGKIIREVLPSRIDIQVLDYFTVIAPEYIMFNAVIAVMYILAVVSVVTTIATIYASVSLDTRRRRKEMALRKLNGAKGKIIGKIFYKTYICIFCVTVLISSPLWIMIAEFFAPNIHVPFGLGQIVGVYLESLLLVIVVAALTISWKIREVMRVDPVEYLNRS